MCKKFFLSLGLLLLSLQLSFSDDWGDATSLPILQPQDEVTLSGTDWNELRMELITLQKELQESSESLGELKSSVAVKTGMLKLMLTFLSTTTGGLAGYAVSEWKGVSWGLGIGFGMGIVLDLTF